LKIIGVFNESNIWMSRISCDLPAYLVSMVSKYNKYGTSLRGECSIDYMCQYWTVIERQ